MSSPTPTGVARRPSRRRLRRRVRPRRAGQRLTGPARALLDVDRGGSQRLRTALGSHRSNRRWRRSAGCDSVQWACIADSGGSPVIAAIIIIVIIVLVGDRVHRPVQRPGPAAEPHRQRVVADRRPAPAPARPDPEPRRDGQGLRRPREARRSKRSSQARNNAVQAQGRARAAGAGRERADRRVAAAVRASPRRTPT